MASSEAGFTGTEDVGKKKRERPRDMEEAGKQDGRT